MPVQQVRAPDGLGGEQVGDNAFPMTGKPAITVVVPIGDGLVLAVSDDQLGTSVAYVLDPATRAIKAIAQLPAGNVHSAAAFGDQAVLTMSEKALLVLNADLSVARRFDVPSEPGFFDVGGDIAYVGLSRPARVVAVSLVDGLVKEVSRHNSEYEGPVLATKTDLWWAIPATGAVRHVRLSDGRQRHLKSCRSPGGMAKLDDTLLVACKEGLLVEIPLDGGRRKVHDGGGITSDVVLAESRD